jgi:predicted oxidoreductase (fatty acid repression mutant protein)
MELLIIILFVAVYLFAFKRGWDASQRNIVGMAVEEVKKQNKKKPEVEKIQAFAEQHGNIFYFYDSEDGSFLAQGKTFDEVKKNLEERFNGSKHITMSAKEAREIGLL